MRAKAIIMKGTGSFGEDVVPGNAAQSRWLPEMLGNVHRLPSDFF